MSFQFLQLHLLSSMKKKRSKWKLFGWFLFIQIVLINISANISAYRYTHFYKYSVQTKQGNNIFSKTWNLFAGPVIYKNFSGDPWPGYEKNTFSTTSGIKLESWYYGSDASKKCVIFFHGVTSRKDHFKAEAECFRSWGYNVLLVDFRAHGNSEGSSTSYGVKETEEVKAALKWSYEKGNKKNIIYGSSMGGAVVLKAASEGIKPDGVIADCPFGSLKEHFQARAKTLGFPAEPFASLVSFWVGVQQGYNGLGHDVKTYAKNIHCPVLIQAGDRDHLVKMGEPTTIYRNIPVTNKKMVTYKGADHHSFLKTHKVEWEKYVREFADNL